MQTTLSIKRGDLWPALICAVPGAWNAPLPDITGASACLLVRDRATEGPHTQMPGQVTLARVGATVRLTYAWEPGDTDEEVGWDAEFKVLLADGRIWTIPGTDRLGRAVYLRITIADTIGEGTFIEAPPTITAVSVADANPNRLVVTTSEATTWTDATGFALAGYTLGSVTGSGTTHYIALTPQVTAGASLGTLSWDATNTVVDATGNQLAPSSRSVTNSVVAPTVVSASIVGAALTVVMSEACSCGGATGLTLSGTSETITSLTSGSGTTTLVFELSGSVTTGTVTLSVSGSNQIADAGGTALAAVSGVSVSLAAAPSIASATIDGDSLTIVYDRAVTHSSTSTWSALVGGVSASVSYVSGSGSATLVYSTSVAAVEGDTVTISASAPTGHVATANGVALAAFADVAVDVASEPEAGQETVGIWVSEYPGVYV